MPVSTSSLFYRGAQKKGAAGTHAQLGLAKNGRGRGLLAVIREVVSIDGRHFGSENAAVIRSRGVAAKQGFR